MKAGRVFALIVDGTNPSYHAVDAAAFNTGLEKVASSVSTALFADETASRCTAIAPNHHWLEAWNDLQIDPERIDIAQPAIQPLYDTRHATESLLAGRVRGCLHVPAPDAQCGLQRRGDVHGPGLEHRCPQRLPAVATPEKVTATYSGSALAGALASVKGRQGGSFELDLYRKVTMGDGQQAGNPMLQETPDPITKTTWDNYVTMARADMEAMGLNTYIAEKDPASVVKVTVNGTSIELPAFPQPGQLPGTVGVALGYGRGAGNEAIGKAAYQVGEGGDHRGCRGQPRPIGKNAFGLAGSVDGLLAFSADVTVEATGETYLLACTQLHHTIMGRDSVVKETTLTWLKPTPSAATPAGTG